VKTGPGAVTGHDEYLTLKDLSLYSKISIRQLERLVHRPINPLPHVRNGRRVLVLRSAFDAWIAAESQRALPAHPGRSADAIIAEVKARHGQTARDHSGA